MNKKICFKIEAKVLLMEQTLVDYDDVPVYFICTDAEQNYYAVLCVDIDKEQYVIVKTEPEKIFNLLTEKITMRELILNETKFWEVKAGNTVEEDVCIQRDIGDICLADMPHENSHFKTVTKEHGEFLKKISLI